MVTRVDSGTPGWATSHNWAKRSSMRPSRSNSPSCWTAVEAEMSGLNTPPRRMSTSPGTLRPNARSRGRAARELEQTDAQQHHAGQGAQTLGGSDRVPRARYRRLDLLLQDTALHP